MPNSPKASPTYVGGGGGEFIVAVAMINDGKTRPPSQLSAATEYHCRIVFALLPAVA